MNAKPAPCEKTLAQPGTQALSVGNGHSHLGSAAQCADRWPSVASEANALIRSGHLATALQLLQRATHDHQGRAPHLCAALAESLALAYGLSGFPVEASRSLLGIKSAGYAPLASSRRHTLRGLLAFLEGDTCSALQSAGVALALEPDPPTDRNLALALLSASYLRLGYWTRALRCLDTMSDPSSDLRDLGWCAGQLLRGEIHFRRALRERIAGPLRTVAAVESRPSRVPLLTLCEQASTAFESAERVCIAYPVMVRSARACRHLVMALRGSQDRHGPIAEAHLRYLQQAGLVHAERDWRWTIGLMHVALGNRTLARTWLLPLAQQAFSSAIPIHEIDLIGVATSLIHPDTANENFRALLAAGDGFDARLRIVHQKVEAIALGELLAGRNGPHRANSEELVQRVESHVRRNLNQHFSVTTLTEALGVSRRKLEMAFRQAKGQSPQQYITELRLAEANLRMSGSPILTGATLRKIALESGFLSYRRFVQTFSQRFGCKPGDPRHDPSSPAARSD